MPIGESWGDSKKRIWEEWKQPITDPRGTMGINGAPDIAAQPGVTYDWGAADAAAAQSNALGGMLMEQAQGKGPSVASSMLAQANQANARQQSAQAQSAQGGAMNRMLAQTQAANQGAQSAQQTAGQMATMRNQEMINSRQQAAQLYAQQQNLAQQRQLGMGDQAVAQRGQNVDVSKANQQNQQKSNAGIAGFAGGIIGGIMSDRRVKDDVHEVPREAMSALLEHLTPKVFHYKGSDHPSIGVIAQEVREGGPAGEAIVHEGDDGMLRIGGTESPALGVVLAELGALHDRLAKVEGRGR